MLPRFQGAEINYLHVGFAIAHYKKLGYEYIEVPWYVSNESILATKPEENAIVQVDYDTNLIGSAEQGFIELLSTYQLDRDRKYVSASPCFRDELNQYEPGFLQPYFFKVELFNQKPTVERMVAEATSLFRTLGGTVKKCHTKDGIDLMVNGIEVGSYGERTVDGKTFTYGTGLAEPRFSYALRSKKNGTP